MPPLHQPNCYYAHPTSIYNTVAETNDLRQLRDLGLTTVNPNHPSHHAEYQAHGMSYFQSLVATCDCLAFRAFPDGRIPAGVAAEIKIAKGLGLPVLELSSQINDRVLTVAETRERLRSYATNAVR